LTGLWRENHLAPVRQPRPKEINMSETEGMRFVDWPLHGVGPKALRVLAEALAARGLSFAEEE
jgi:hypothetical protein